MTDWDDGTVNHAASPGWNSGVGRSETTESKDGRMTETAKSAVGVCATCGMPARVILESGEPVQVLGVCGHVRNLDGTLIHPELAEES